MSRRNYLKFIGYLQVIGIILVVLGHSFHEYPDAHHGYSLLVVRMIYSFHMPLFIFISGFLLYYVGFLGKERKQTPGIYIYQKIKRLIIPYIVLTTVTFLPRASLSMMADDKLHTDLATFLRSFFYGNSLVIPFFWFLQASFILLIVCYSILYISHRTCNGEKGGIITLLIISIALYFLPLQVSTFWSFNKICALGIYFVIGICYGYGYERIDRIVPWNSVIFLIIMGCIWAVSFYFTENTGWVWICAMAGIMMCISFAKLLVRYKFTFLDHLIGANYIIFLLSWYFNICMQQVLHHFTNYYWWVYTLLSLFFGIYVPYIFYRWMERHKEKHIVKGLAFLLGQQFKNRR
ncbi:MAG: acyltransferase family protein [Muribaculaceae bacterium]|nr:acyltransferase family protein [Muribaculaceae bacterium]